MFKLNRKTVLAIEALGWNVWEDEEHIMFSNSSPAGEDLYEECSKDEDVLDWALNLANNFDVDEHVEMWVDAKRSGVSGVPTIRELVADADKIQDMYDDLCDTIRENCVDEDDIEEDDEEY